MSRPVANLFQCLGIGADGPDANEALIDIHVIAMIETSEADISTQCKNLCRQPISIIAKKYDTLKIKALGDGMQRKINGKGGVKEGAEELAIGFAKFGCVCQAPSAEGVTQHKRAKCDPVMDEV
jgi:hypothetical protein